MVVLVQGEDGTSFVGYYKINTLHYSSASKLWLQYYAKLHVTIKTSLSTKFYIIHTYSLMTQKTV